MFDIKISDTTIVDGSGNTPYRGDIGINSDRIIEIGDLSGIAAKRELDGSGLTTLPGFIDTHSHADGVLLHAPQGVHSIAQGVTTEILTQDGMGWAPLSADKYCLLYTSDAADE